MAVPSGKAIFAPFKLAKLVMVGCSSRVISTLGSMSKGSVKISHLSRSGLRLTKLSNWQRPSLEAASDSSQVRAGYSCTFRPTRSRTNACRSAAMPTCFPAGSITSNGSQTGSTHSVGVWLWTYRRSLSLSVGAVACAGSGHNTANHRVSAVICARCRGCCVLMAEIIRGGCYCPVPTAQLLECPR